MGGVASCNCRRFFRYENEKIYGCKTCGFLFVRVVALVEYAARRVFAVRQRKGKRIYKLLAETLFCATKFVRGK